MIGLAHALAKPLAPYGVTVNSVTPALIETDMLSENSMLKEQLSQSIPVGRLGLPDEVAQAVLALVANPYITAQTLSVDGGIYPR